MFVCLFFSCDCFFFFAIPPTLSMALLLIKQHKARPPLNMNPRFLSHLCSLAPASKSIVSNPRADPLFFVRLLPTPETTRPAPLIVKIKKNLISKWRCDLVYLFIFIQGQQLHEKQALPLSHLANGNANNVPRDAEQRIR